MMKQGNVHHNIFASVYVLHEENFKSDTIISINREKKKNVFSVEGREIHANVCMYVGVKKTCKSCPQTPRSSVKVTNK